VISGCQKLYSRARENGARGRPLVAFRRSITDLSPSRSTGSETVSWQCDEWEAARVAPLWAIDPPSRVGDVLACAIMRASLLPSAGLARSDALVRISCLFQNRRTAG
jgi:hypothetical protein